LQPTCLSRNTWCSSTQKCDLCLKTTPFGGKNVIFSNFRVNIQLFLNLRNFISIKFGFPAHFYPKRDHFKVKIAFLRLFASIHRPSLNQGNVFSLILTTISHFLSKIAFLRLFASIHGPSLNHGGVFSLIKCQIRIPRMFLGSFLEKNFEKFWSPYCVVAPNFCPPHSYISGF
jgi:hypothetical protein